MLFHYLLGVRYFYIGIHKTTDYTVAVLEQLSRYINIKTFAVADTTYQALQQDFYQYTLDRFQLEVDWMAFIDQDEFLFAINHFILRLKALDQSLLEGKVLDKRSPDIFAPLSRRLSFIKEMILNVYHNRKLSLSRVLGLGIKKKVWLII